MIKLTVKSGNTLIQVEGEDQISVFKEIASAQETFGEEKCGKCGNTNLKYVVRKTKDSEGEEFEYPELRCTNGKCRAKLSFGQEKKGGGLFPIRFERDGKKYKTDANGKKIMKGSWGWVIYNRDTQQEE